VRADQSVGRDPNHGARFVIPMEIPRMSQQPVLVVGGGPVGLTAALTLKQHGIPCRIIDRAGAPSMLSRAAGVHARTMEVFERIGVIAPFLAQARRLKGMSLEDQDGRVLAQPDMSAGDTHYGYVVSLRQDETERILREALAAQGGEIERGVELVTFSQDGRRVLATLKHADGRMEEMETPYLVGCDGAHSTTRKTLGLPMEGETEACQWMTADCEMDWDRTPEHALIRFARDGFAFIIPIDGPRWRVAVGVEGVRVEKPDELTLDLVERLLNDRIGIRAKLSNPRWVTPFNINTRKAPKLNIGRVFICGDAAHVHSPLGGQGMTTGIQDAYNLTWKIAHALKGYVRPEFVASYDDEREANAKRLLDLVGPMTKAAGFSDPIAVALRNSVISIGAKVGMPALMGRKLGQLEVHYRESPIVAEHSPGLSGWLHSTLSGAQHPGLSDVAEFRHGVHPGERAPDVLLMRNERNLDVRLHQEWAGDHRYQCLIFTGSHPKKERVGELIAFARRLEAASQGIIRARLVRHSAVDAPEGLWDVNGIAHQRYGASYECLYLVRPDGYVGFRSQPVEWAPLASYLDRTFAPGVIREAKQSA